MIQDILNGFRVQRKVHDKSIAILDGLVKRNDREDPIVRAPSRAIEANQVVNNVPKLTLVKDKVIYDDSATKDC